MKEITQLDVLKISGGKDAGACSSAILGAGSMGAVAGGAGFFWAGPYAGLAAGVGALTAGAYAARNNPACR